MLTIQILSEWMDYLTQKQADISTELEATSVDRTDEQERLSKKHAEITAALSTANVDLANAIAAKKKEQEEGCSILASDVKFVPFIQMVSQTGKVEKQENGGMLVHSKFCDKVPKPRFANEVRPSYCFDKEGVDLARQWAVVDEVTKAKYQAQADEEKIRYQKELDAQQGEGIT